MNDKDRKLGSFLSEVANWDWEQFCLAENDPQFTSNEAVIFAVIRACAMEKLDAIRMALNRLDGKLKTPVRIEMPKVFFLYPYAKAPEDVTQLQPGDDVSEDITSQMELLASDPKAEDEEPDLATLSLRQTLTKMADYPREVPIAVIEFATATQQWLQHPDKNPEPEEKPAVKSVVAAHLLHLAANRNLGALNEVFDQIDGKLVETIQILGDDIFIVSYSIVAPDGAYLNKNGVLQLEATQAQDTWAQKLGQKNGG
jgi:hypothetical protein